MMSPLIRRVLPPAVVTALALLAVIGPGIPRQQPLADALVVIDITRSMNVRDMDGEARLERAKRIMQDWIATRPCGSRIGLGVFTERRSLTLFEPIEVCAGFAPIEDSLLGLDWRMAWDGDSMISKGLDHALARASDLGVSLVFITDGQEAPPLPHTGRDRFGRDSPGGLILGAGGDRPAPIPKFDDLGREVGFYDPSDVQHAPSPIAPPPEDASERPGYHPISNPHGYDATDLEGSEHLSNLRAAYLRELADERGLGFLRLAEGPAAIERAFVLHAPAHVVDISRSLSPVLAAVALLLLLALWTGGNRFKHLTRKGIK